MKRRVALAVALASGTSLLAAAAPASADWQGFYVGGGVTLQNWGVGFRPAGATLTIDDSTTSGVDFTYRGPTHFEGASSVGGHVLLGYLRQRNKWVFGLEGDYEFGNGFYREGIPSSLGGLSSAVSACVNPSIPATGYFACVAPNFFFGEVETQGHVRGLVGLTATPQFMGFIAAGLAIGRSPAYVSATDGGIVAHSPSAPLVGVARVTRSGIAKTIYGFTIGGGFEVKASPNLRLRAEYLYDRYNPLNFSLGGAGFGGTIGTVTTNSFAGISSGSAFDIDTHTIRVSAVYQFNRGGKNETWAPIVSDWTGPFAGVGITVQRSNVAFPNQVSSVSIDNNTTAGVVEFTAHPPLDHAGGTVGGAVIAGYMRQHNKWVFGGEGDFDFRNGFKVDKPPTGDNGSVAIPECSNPAIIFTGTFGCVGLASNFGEFKTLGHVRGTVGFAATKTMMGFAAVGVAIARSPDSIGSTGGGFYASSPSAPLVGVANVTRSGIGKTIYGLSLGGGVQVMMDEKLRLRAEYLFDWYKPIPIAVGGAGFGGTIGDATINSFATVGDRLALSSQSVRLSLIYQY